MESLIAGGQCEQSPDEVPKVQQEAAHLLRTSQWGRPLRYRKVPVEIEAFRLGHDPKPPVEWWGDRKLLRVTKMGASAKYPEGTLIIPTLEGDRYARPGNWIVKDVKGEVYPVRDDIFRLTYVEAA